MILLLQKVCWRQRMSVNAEKMGHVQSYIPVAHVVHIL